MKYPTLTISTKDPTKGPVGANLRVLLDGEPLHTACAVKFEATARGLNKITLELYGHAEIEALGEYQMNILPLTGKKKRKKK